MCAQSVLEKLQAAAPTAEIWWDSSPLVYDAWKSKLLSEAPDSEVRASWSDELARFIDPNAPIGALVRGVTTNPTLIAKSIIEAPDIWVPEVREAHLRQSRPDVQVTYWTIYLEAVRRAALAMLPFWYATNGQYGWVSGQVDPRCVFDSDHMLEQGLQIARLAPNIMVKVPGTRQGYATISRLVARGISFNGTFSYSLPQFSACVRAVESGLSEAGSQGIELSRWRGVITHMIGRFGSQGDLLEEAAARGMELTAKEVRYAEIAILKQAYRMLSQKRLPLKMLLSSLSADTPETGALSMHLEETAGADVVYTCKPGFVADLLRRGSELERFDERAIEREIPAATLAKLRRLPYFAKAYDPDGMLPDEFANHGAFITTYAEVARNTRRLVDFVAQHCHRLAEPHAQPAFATSAA